MVKKSSDKVDDSWTVKQLEAYCKENKLKGYEDMKKDELIAAINSGKLSK